MNDLGLGIIVSMKDAFSQNAMRIQASMQSLDATVAAASERMTHNLDRIQKGTMMIGAGLATLAVPAALVASTAATQKALGEMASLGTKDLRTLEDAAESFTNTWAGSTKAEFIGAAYDVKSALANLSDEAVGTFAGMAALTAKATKSSIEEMVGTFTVGYGIFKPIMSDMNDMEWAQAFSGAMAQTVAAFKTTGPQMAEAIKNIGAVAASANIPLQEQLAILGQLQTTMPGSEAGTLYKAFMMKAAEAGEELGLSFTDSAGRLKGVTAILREIQTLYPDLSKAAAQVELKKAFGSDEALKFVLQMSSGLVTLEGNIQGIEKAMRDGTAATEEMARAMNMDIGSQMALLKQQVSNLFEILGRTLLPVITPIVGGLSKMIVFFQKVARSIPGVTRVALALTAALGGALVIVGAVTAAVGLIGVSLPAIAAGFAAIGPAAAGVGAAIAASFWPVTLAIAGVIGAIWLLRKAWTSNFAGIRDVVMGAWEKVSLAFQGIKALMTSLNGGMGQMSAELAQKLEAAGLMGFVVTVFKMYYRVREFLGGLSQAFSQAFKRIRAILEPAVRSLLSAYGQLYKALFSVFKVFGVVSTAADGSSFRSLGATLGTVIGVIAQVGAFIIRWMIEPLAWVVRGVASVVEAVVGMGTAVINAFITAGEYVARFVLPVRMVWQAFVSLGEIIYSVWQIISGGVSVADGLQAIGGAVLDFLITPFQWAQDAASAALGFIQQSFGAIGSFFSTAATQVTQAILNMPIVATLQQMLATVRDFFAGDLTFFESGKRLMKTLGDGILAAASYPYEMLKKTLGKLRDLMPFSDAKEGPLSQLTASGSALLKTLAEGMNLSASLPGKVFTFAAKGLMSALSSVGGSLREHAQSALSVIGVPFEGMAGLWAGLTGKVKGIAAGMAGRVSELVAPIVAPVSVVPSATAVGSLNVSPKAAPATLELPLAQHILDAVLNLVPKLDMRLVPKMLGATLMLSPVLAAAAPEQQALVSAGVQSTSPRAVNSRAVPDLETQITASAPQLAPLHTMHAAIQGRVIAEPLQGLNADIAATLHPAMPMISPPDIALGLQPQLRALPPLNIPGVIAAQPPNIAGVAVPGNAPEVSPTPERFAEYQQPRQPAERPSVFRDQPADSFKTGSASEEGIRPLLEALLAKMDALAERPIDVTVTTQLDGRKIAESVYRDLREQRIRNYETL